MSKTLVVYFSAEFGATKKLAKTFAEVTGGDLYEIQPKVPYTKADVNWMNNSSRSIYEMRHKDLRPEVTGKVENMEQYDTIYLGFPIWCGVAPTIVNTFLEQYDLSGKTIVTFGTSGGSSFGRATNPELAPSCPGAKLTGGKVFRPGTSAPELKKWIEGLGL